MGEWLPWATAMQRALFGPGGFYLGATVPAAHFRTSVTVAPDLVANAIVAVLEHVQAELGSTSGAPVDLVDLGAGGGELLAALAGTVPRHVRLHGVDVAARPPGLPPGVTWSSRLPEVDVAVVVAHEYLDNVPVDVVEVAPDGAPRHVLVDAATGAERLGGPLTGADTDWIARWWPLQGAPAGTRAEIGRARDAAWSEAVGRVRRGVALAIDYDHLLAHRPRGGTLTGYRRGRVVAAVPDGSCDLTAHVALDACGAAGQAAGATATVLIRQSEALRALGLDPARPRPADAREDPLGYLRALAAAGTAAELLDRTGLGGFGWLVQGVGVRLPDPFRRIE